MVNRIDLPGFSCALHVSGDGGSSWSQPAIPMPQGEEPKCYVPDLAWDAGGTLYLSFVTLKGRGNVPNAVWLSRSTDGGRTLSTPRRLLGPLAFQARLTADPETPGVYLTWLSASDVALFRFGQTGNPVRVMRSDDGGREWTASARVSRSACDRVVAPCGGGRIWRRTVRALFGPRRGSPRLRGASRGPGGLMRRLGRFWRLAPSVLEAEVCG